MAGKTASLRFVNTIYYRYKNSVVRGLDNQLTLILSFDFSSHLKYESVQ